MRLYAQYNVRALSRLALYNKRRAYALRMGVHSAQSEVSGAAVLQQLFSHAIAIIGDLNLKHIGQKTYFHCYIVGLCVTKGICQRLAADAVYLVTDQRVHFAQLAFGNQVEHRQ